MYLLTDWGTEFNGRLEHHEYELYLEIEDIDHSKTKVRHPQSNGICVLSLDGPGRILRGHIPKENLSGAESLQADLDQWIAYYNEQRPHSGRYCFGKMPMQTFADSLNLAKQKMLNEIGSAA